MRWKHNAACVAIPVACPDCRTICPRGDLESHRKTCVLRTIKLENGSVTTAFDLEKHNRIRESQKRRPELPRIAAKNLAKHMQLCEAVRKPAFAKAVRTVRELVPRTSTDEDLAVGTPLPRPATADGPSEGGSSRRPVRASESPSAIHDRDEWFLLRRIDDLTNDTGDPKLAKRSNDKLLLQKADKLLSHFALAGNRA